MKRGHWVWALVLMLLVSLSGCGGGSEGTTGGETAVPDAGASVTQPEPTAGAVVERGSGGETAEEPSETSAPDAEASPAETTTFVVFAGEAPDEEGDIYVIDSMGANLANLTNSPEDDNTPGWSPDGSRIVWVVETSDDVDELVVMNADGGNRQTLTSMTGTMNTPAWSPDGSQIVFRAEPVDGDPDIYAIDADGSNLRQLTATPANDTSPSWSPDGSQILFAADEDGSGDIFVMDADGGNVTAVTTTPDDEESPQWSPDGAQIAYVLDANDNEDIYVMNADGGNRRRLTTHPENDDSPTWSPDGRFILFNSDRNGNGDQLYVVSVDGSDVRLLAGDESLEAGAAAVQPVGGALVAFGGEAVEETAVAAADEPAAEEGPRPTPTVDPNSPIFATAAYSLADLIPASFSPEPLSVPEGGEVPRYILEAYYATEARAPDVIEFYKTALADLGWTLDGEYDSGFGYYRLEFIASGVQFQLAMQEEDLATIVIANVYAREITFASIPVLDDAQLGRLVWGRSAVYFDDSLTEAEMTQFYRETMPASGWTLRNDIEAQGQSWLEFVRSSSSGEDVATVRADDGDGAGTPAQVRVSVSYAEPRQVALADYGYFYEEGLDPALLAAAEKPVIPTAEAGASLAANTSLPAFNPADFSGDIVAGGSSTIFPLAEAIASRFQDDGFSGDIVINSTGSSLGPLCSGQADIANYVAQIITASERDECAPEGAEVVDFVVGRDVLVMAINPANDFAAEMTQAELIRALTTAETWADVNPAWPDLPLQRFYPVISYQGVAGFLGTDPQLMENAVNLTRSEDDNALVAGVAQNEGGIGFFAYGVYANNQESVTAVRLDGSAPADTDYLLSLPLHMVTFDAILREKPQVAAYLGYALVYGPELALEVGYAPPDVETRQENEALWLEVMGE